MNKTVVVYEDHRYILNVLKYARSIGVTKNSVNVISLDYHTDSYDNPRLFTKDKIERVIKSNLKEFWNYVEFEHCNQDDDWVVGGMQYGLIKDIVMLFSKDNPGHLEFNQLYTDSMGQYHWPIHLTGSSDEKWFDKLNSITDDIYVLDIDLDFATKTIDDLTIAYSDDELDAFFNTCLLYTSPSPRDATLSRMPSSA